MAGGQRFIADVIHLSFFLSFFLLFLLRSLDV